MLLAADPPGFDCRERLAGPQQQPQRKANMSAKAIADFGLELGAEQTAATDQQTPESIAVEIQFHEDLWREYRLEAMNAGFNTAQATEYAGALSSEMSSVSGVSGIAPVGRGWFYQSRTQVVRRTFASGLIKSTHWGRTKAPGRTAAAGASILARGLRWWNVGGKR
jgi:hypothetical protein